MFSIEASGNNGQGGADLLCNNIEYVFPHLSHLLHGHFVEPQSANWQADHTICRLKHDNHKLVRCLSAEPVPG